MKKWGAEDKKRITPDFDVNIRMDIKVPFIELGILE